jgi:purine-nucleoside phosphorylase
VSLRESLDEAARHVSARTALRPALGLVLGSGLGAFAETLEGATRIPFTEIPHFPAASAAGHQGQLVLGRQDGIPIAVLAGRVHHYEGYSFGEVVFPVRVLGRLGVRILVLTNAAGSINLSYLPGELMIIDDHINLMGGNPLVGPNDDDLGPRFPDMTEAYDPELRHIAESACLKVGVPVRHGVYVGFSGPSYETPAEIRLARTLGADAVGMSTVPEVIAARHLGMRVLGLSCLTNMAAGVSRQRLDHRDVLAMGERVRQRLLEVLGAIVRQAAGLA